MCPEGSGDSTDGVPVPVGSTSLVHSGDEISALAFASGHCPDQSNLLAVTVRRSPQEFFADWRATGGRVTHEVGVVGVGESARSATAHSQNGEAAGNAIRIVPDLDDLATIEGHVQSFLQEWQQHDALAVIIVDSMGGLLCAARERETTKFVSKLADLIAEAGAIGFLFTDRESVVEAVEHECDDVIQTRPEGWQLVESDYEQDEKPRVVSVDQAFSLLAVSDRRAIVRYLDEEQEATLDELASHLAVGTSLEERNQLTASLVHKHLPKLDSAGVVEYDQNAGVVERSEAASALEPLLEWAAGWE